MAYFQLTKLQGFFASSKATLRRFTHPAHASGCQRKSVKIINTSHDNQLILLQGNDTPTATRIRDNQRRSRNRRKELIDDLQKRIQEYEQKGVTATQEVQRAARRVAEENASLRDLLSRRGVSQGEIADHLRSFRAQGPSLIPVYHSTITEPESIGRRKITSERDHTLNQTHFRPVGQDQLFQQQQRPALVDASADRLSDVHELPRSSEIISQDHNCQSIQRTNDKSCRKPAPEEPECPNTADCFCPPSTTANYQPPDVGFEISCEAAATIIVEMRGDGDIDSARASLGCSGPEECSVKNSTVLQIMDEG